MRKDLPKKNVRYCLWWNREQKYLMLKRIYKNKNQTICVFKDTSDKELHIPLGHFYDKQVDNPITNQDLQALYRERNKNVCEFVYAKHNRWQTIQGLLIVDKIYYINDNDKISYLTATKNTVRIEDRYADEIPTWAHPKLIEKYKKTKKKL